MDTRGIYASPLTGWNDVPQLVDLMNTLVRHFEFWIATQISSYFVIFEDPHSLNRRFIEQISR